MKKTLAILLLLSLLLFSPGCARQASPLVKNDVFTDDFFAGVVEIRATGVGQLCGGDLAPVLAYLKGLTLTETAQHLRATNEAGEPLYGLGCITFVRSDGTERSFLMNHATLTGMEGSGFAGRSFTVASENLNTGLKEAFALSMPPSEPPGTEAVHRLHRASDFY